MPGQAPFPHSNHLVPGRTSALGSGPMIALLARIVWIIAPGGVGEHAR